jgi:hypothetical protein
MASAYHHPQNNGIKQNVGFLHILMIKVQLLEKKYIPLQVVSNIERKETCNGENRRHRQSPKV